MEYIDLLINYSLGVVMKLKLSKIGKIVIALILVIAGLTYAWCDYNSREDTKQMVGELI